MNERPPSTPDPRTDDGRPKEPLDSARLQELKLAAVQARPRRVHFFLSHEAHFLDPLVPEEFERLHTARVSTDVVDVAVRLLEEEIADDATPRIYFPVPMARALSGGAGWSEVVARFRYDMILVDEEQRWSWRGGPVAERTREFFVDHLAWQPAVERWYFEYKIHDGWWDKSYLEAEVTPLRGLRFDEGSGEEPLRLVLQDGRRVVCAADSFRLDQRERLFVRSHEMGEVLVSDTERFRILRTADEDLATVEVAGRRVALAWPPAGAPAPDAP